jgi:dolichol-phosphate mannosyltransferase
MKQLEEHLRAPGANQQIFQPARFQAKVWFVLPVYNEGQAILDLLKRIEDVFHGSTEQLAVVVADDGSTDGVADEIVAFSKSLPLTYLGNPKNVGLGMTMKRGIEWVLKYAESEDVVVTMDGDNTHPPESVFEMLRLIDQGNEVVIASRFQPGATIEGLNANREWLSRLGRFMFIAMAPMKNVADYTCGFRAIRVAALRRAADYWGEKFMTETGFTVTADLLLKMRKQSVRCAEIPLHLRYQNKTSPSKMKVLRTTLETLRLLVKHRLFLR